MADVREMKIPSGVKDILVLVVVFSVILGSLFAYTGVWPPAVIVESGSMMHDDSEVRYGRIGTIDPGDMVLVKRVGDSSTVETYAQGGRDHYGDPGDVIVYYPKNNREATPIIHRAMTWVEVDIDEEGAFVYRVQWQTDRDCPNSDAPPVEGWCTFGQEGITIPEFGLYSYRPAQGGLVTKGDNPFTNARADQVSGLSDIVQPEWIEGKSRGEIPWLGLIKLALSDQRNERSPPASWVHVYVPPFSGPTGGAYAPQDLWVMLGISLFLLIGVPVGYDAYKALEERRRKQASPQASDGARPPLAPSEPAIGPVAMDPVAASPAVEPVVDDPSEQTGDEPGARPDGSGDEERERERVA